MSANADKGRSKHPTSSNRLRRHVVAGVQWRESGQNPEENRLSFAEISPRISFVPSHILSIARHQVMPVSGLSIMGWMDLDSRPGSHSSSASRNAMNSALVEWIPRFRAGAGPVLFWWIHMTGFGYVATMFRVLSVEPSSTTMISLFG